MRPLVVFAFLLLAGCGGNNAAKRMQVADRFSSNMPPPSRSLDEFAHFEILEVTMESGVEQDERKVRVAEQLEDKLRVRLGPMLEGWSRADGPTLQIQPHVVELRVVSGGSRFWLGAMAGDSHLDMDLVLVDAESKQPIARAAIRQDVGGTSGAWSVGASDRNLLNYISDIVYAFLHKHHKATRDQPLVTGDEDQ
jgi:hypothetical protein